MITCIYHRLVGNKHQTNIDWVNDAPACQALNDGSGAFVGLAPNDYTALQTLLTQSTSAQSPTLQDIFAMPIASDLQQMFMLGFGYPIMCYLAAWGFGVLINMFNTSESVTYINEE